MLAKSWMYMWCNDLIQKAESWQGGVDEGGPLQNCCMNGEFSSLILSMHETDNKRYFQYFFFL